MNSNKASTLHKDTLLNDTARLGSNDEAEAAETMGEANNNSHHHNHASQSAIQPQNRLPPIFPFPYAVSWGEDVYGIFQDIGIPNTGIVQRMRWIPPGSFYMGSPESELARYDEEHYQYVEINHGFWLADTTVTQALWRAVMGENPSHSPKNEQYQNVRRELPVDSVSWYECQEFMRRLIQLMPALMWQLPSEAEWEYACRAGTTTPFSTGENITTAQANYDGNDPYAYFDKGECRETTVPVKSFAPNLWGLYQMHGNVSEWCDGPWRDKALAQQREAIEPADEKYPPQGVVQQVRSDEQTYVLRGGSWCSDGQDSRSAHRFDLRADDRGSFIGLRLSLGHELQGR